MEEFNARLDKTVHKMEGLMDLSSLIIRNLSKDSHFNLPAYLTKFSALDSNLAKMNFVYEDLEKYKVYPRFQEDQKNDKQAIEQRETGNVYFKLGKYRKALDYYTVSILKAQSKKMAAFAYGNRSAALSKLNLHQECLTDIDRALNNDYPDDLKPRLILRQQHSKAQKIPEIRSYEPVPKFRESERNPQIQNARNCVKIMKNEKYGRYVVATRDIKIGEVLATEAPYAAILDDEFYVYCHECFQLCYNLIPCDKCTKTLYCGDICKDKAFSAYHKYECPILSSLDLIQIDFPKRLALKIVFMAKNEWNNPRSILANTGGLYCSDRFKEIRDLDPHTTERGSLKSYSRTALACGVFYLIKNHTTLLQEGISEDHLKEVLLFTILACGTNTVGMNELRPNEKGIFELNSIVTALYPFFTLFNHSCSPNVSRHYHGSTIVLRTISTIKKGEQCFVEYGPYYLYYPKEFRQSFLKEQHFFTCTCRACEENWPMRGSIPVDLNWSKVEFLTALVLQKADVNAAKRELQQLLVKMKTSERSLPATPASHNFVGKELLKLCYDVFGNKRRI